MNAGAMLAVLRRLRRRAFLVSAARAALVASLFMLAVAPALLGFHFASAKALASIGLAALAAAVLVAAARQPSFVDVARAADRRLRLQNRAATALQHLADGDTMALLLVRDATRHLEGSRAADVFPFALPRHFRKLALASVALAVAGSVSLPGADRLFSTGAGGGGASTDTSSGTRGERSAISPENPSSAAAGARTATSPDGRGGSPRPQDGAAPPPDAPSVSSAQRTDEPRGDASGSGRSAAGAIRPTPAATGRSGFGASGASATETTARVAKAGGAGDPAAGRAPAGRAEGTHRGGPDARQQQALAAAERAVAAGRVPPGLATYVRAYFAAIRER